MATKLSLGLVITLFIAFMLAGALLPTAFSQIFNADTAGWGDATVTVWILLPLMGAIGLMIAVIAPYIEGI